MRQFEDDTLISFFLIALSLVCVASLSFTNANAESVDRLAIASISGAVALAKSNRKEK